MKLSPEQIALMGVAKSASLAARDVPWGSEELDEAGVYAEPGLYEFMKVKHHLQEAGFFVDKFMEVMKNVEEDA